MTETKGSTFVVVGGGLAGAKAVEALREQGYDGRLVLVAAEAHLPYERPPLSKGYLAGADERDSFVVHPQQWYAEHDVDLRLGVAASTVDAAAHTVTLADGDVLSYDQLLLATGSQPRRLNVPGADADGVHYLRTVDDSEALRGAVSAGTRMVVIGAGWIGLEVTAFARQAGAEVTVIESAQLPLLRVLGPELAQVFADLHREHGVDLRFGASLTEFAVSDGRVTGAVLADGTTVPADLIVVGIGAAPDVALARAAGLGVDNGVLADAALRTTDPDIVVAGDIANAEHPLLGRRVRVEHWANALNQPAVAARTMRGESAAWDELPYFYSDQYDLGMEYIGYVEPGDYDRVVFRGDRDAREFVAFWLSADDRVLAGMNVNVWDVVDDIKALIRANQPVDVAALVDVDRPIADAAAAS